MSDEVSSGNEPEETLADVVADAETVLLDEISRQRDEYLDSLQRLQADFENYRKRVSRTADDVASRTAADVVTKLLPTLDALDLAEAHFARDDGEAEFVSEEVVALSQARSLLLDALEKEGLTRIAEAGVPFDPQIHDAVAHVSDESSEGQVVDDVLRAGYQWKGMMIRPAMVRVKG